MLLLILWSTLLLIHSSTRAQQERLQPAELELFNTAQKKLEQNYCPVLVLPDARIPILRWQCGFPYALKLGNYYEYECCPGYEPSSIVNNMCILREPNWKTIVEYLQDKGNTATADLLKTNTGLPGLYIASSKSVYTVFVSEEDSDVRSRDAIYLKERNGARILVSSKRYYSHHFQNGKTILNANFLPMKISTYSNGLMFLECRRFVKVDLDMSNGVVHFLNGVLPNTQPYPTILSRLQAEPDAENFVQSMPPDVRAALDQINSSNWYTVFAPTNRAWSEAISLLNSEEAISALVRHHVLNKIICAGAIIQASSKIGPTMGNGYLRMVRRSDGNPAVLDACGQEINVSKKDMMSMTGVVHMVDRTMVSLEAMNLEQALQCLQASGRFQATRAAREMIECDFGSNNGSKNVILLPDSNAFEKLQSSAIDQQRENRLRMDREYRCNAYAYHVLTPATPQTSLSVNGAMIQGQVLQTGYSTLGGSATYIIADYISERDGNRINFNGALTKDVKPIKFCDGYIYLVNRFNFPPESSMLDLIKQKGNTRQIVQKIYETEYLSSLKQLSPKVLFLAPIDMGWTNRGLENSYSIKNTWKLLQLHTIPHAIFGVKEDLFWRQTVMNIDSMLTGRDGKKVMLIIKRNPDGNTFIGHEGLLENLWAMVLDSNMIGTDGVVWTIDWPVKCPEHTC